MNTTKNNLLLEFLDFQLIMDDPVNSPEGYYHNGEFPLHAEELAFQDNWNHLMFLVDKIETLETKFDGRFVVYIHSNSCTIQSVKFDSRPESKHYWYFFSETLATKIDSVYYCCTMFIQWWNQNHKK